jgi:hypothetical protein
MATEKEQQKQAAKHLKLKLKQERRLTSTMRRFFNEQNRQFFDMHSSVGLTLNASIFKTDLSQILNKHYRDTAGKFSKFVIDDLNKTLKAAGEEKVDADNPEILAVLLMFIQQNVQRSVDQITATSNSNMVKAVESAGGDSTAAYKQLQELNFGRSKVIAVTETQKAAEGSKQVIAQRAARVVTGASIVRKVIISIKTWVTVGDSDVRDWHAIANRQEVPLDDPFSVAGEFLMHPGDDSLGASLSNIIHCRCVSLISWFRI